MSAEGILFVCMNYAPELTGCGKYTGDLGAELARREQGVTVVTTPPHYPGWAAQAPYSNRYRIERTGTTTVVRCPLIMRSKMSGVWRVIAPLSFALSAAPVILWHAIRKRPTTILLVEPTLLAAPITLVAAKLCGAVSVLYVQDLEVDAAFAVGHLNSYSWLRTLGKKFEAMCTAAFDKVIVSGQKMADKISAEHDFGPNLAVIRNWVETSLFRSGDDHSEYRAELGLPSSVFVALYAGNLGAKQGLDVIIEAAKRLSDDDRILFVIAGEGPEKVNLEKAAAGLKNVAFLPLQPAERLGDFLRMCDLHLLPQRASVGDLLMPSKLGGMLASGRPIIVTATPEMELGEFTKDVATVIPPEDPEAFARAVERVASGEIVNPVERQLALARELDSKVAFDRLEAFLFTEARTTSDAPND